MYVDVHTLTGYLTSVRFRGCVIASRAVSPKNNIASSLLLLHGFISMSTPVKEFHNAELYVCTVNTYIHNNPLYYL